MAFDTAQTKINAVGRAGNVLGRLRTIYSYCKEIEAALALYAAGTDAAFNAAINALFTAPERAVLNDMLADIATLTADWEANHTDVINIT
jgi:hypothetical protein